MSDQERTQQPFEDTGEFGANTWFAEYLYQEYKDNPAAIPEQWLKYFRKEGDTVKPVLPDVPQQSTRPHAVLPPLQPLEGDILQLLVGSAQRIIDNMENSLTVPVATSQRTIPVKLLEENRLLINTYLTKTEQRKISFTHIIAYAIVAALKKYPSINNTFTVVDEKSTLIRHAHVNLGIAVDLQRKDGSRSLMVPNIKNAERLSFKEFLIEYEDLIQRTRTGQIDPAAFAGTTLSLTNPGTLGTISSIPRLMFGQGAIIATGSIQLPPGYEAVDPAAISSLGISKIVNITCTYDHRIIQGAESGLFLNEVHQLLLGAGNFYESIFADLHIPMRPLVWQKDTPAAEGETIPNIEEIAKHGRVRQMINMYRVRGHLIASIDPLGSKTVYHEELDPAFYNLTVWDLDRHFVTHDFGGFKTATLRRILEKLHRTYCENIGVEYMHIQTPAEKSWLQSRMEPVENTPAFDDEAKRTILRKLIQAEGLEHFIHAKFVGHKRFSLEGSETVIPVLDHLLTVAADNGVKEIVLGMSHRGRLNVLVNIVGKAYESLFAEFEDISDPNSFAGSGDVKYHLGASGKYKTRFRKEIAVSIASNPSHLEWVNPVVEGIVRAKQSRLPDIERRSVIPVLIHGDGAFAGQGIVAETLNLSQLKGYQTGGTIHLIVNNQIGFTTTPEEARSTVYASDVAKMVQAPIFHVNGDDPEAALYVIRLAFEYRQLFKKDVVIDLLGYRRHGHNEGDDPGFTQPLLYEKIKNYPSVLTKYAAKLIREKVLSNDDFQRMQKEFYDKLSSALDQTNERAKEYSSSVQLSEQSEMKRTPEATALPEVPVTAVSEETLTQIMRGLTGYPEQFNAHPKLKKLLEKRAELTAKEDGLADWAAGESIAFGSILLEGYPVRLSGQDSVRGTFSQRHLALADIKNGKEYLPVNFIDPAQAKAEALDSLLSEAAVLGFEYGYSTEDPNTLVLWEAQFGDFANGAQIMIDNFIVVSYEKWQTPNNLVLLLPHGYEGQGPEHSSARLERFLILCAQDNMEVAYPTTPAQYFHLLRRQILKKFKRPLIVMTPKSMLRLPEARSAKHEFLHGTFMEFLDDAAITDASEVKRIILTSGKIYYELNKYRISNNKTDAAVIRIEQFYPFESGKLADILAKYPAAEKIVWVQEEPENMGAANFLYRRLTALLKPNQTFAYSGRPASASPALGSAKKSAQAQQLIITQAFS